MFNKNVYHLIINEKSLDHNDVWLYCKSYNYCVNKRLERVAGV